MPGPKPKDFWEYVQKGDESECWLWLGGRTREGYGLYSTWTPVRKTEIASRIAWRLTHGQDVPEDMEIRHSCDNPPCCNPAHMTLGTHAENMYDRSIRKRGQGYWKLTWEDVNRIRELAGTATHKELAKQFGVQRATITQILNNRSWRT